VFDKQLAQIRGFISEWNGNKTAPSYYQKSQKLRFSVGELKETKDSMNKTVRSLSDSVKLEQKLWDDLEDIYPYTKRLTSEVDGNYKPLSFFAADIGDLVVNTKTESMSQIMASEDEERTPGLNVTMDLSYEVEKQGSAKSIIHKVEGIPIIRKMYYQNFDDMKVEDRITKEMCELKYHGRFLNETDECLYYLQARKICLVIDQEMVQGSMAVAEPTYKMLPGYEYFRCNYLNHRNDYVMWQYLRWYDSDPNPNTNDTASEPKLKDITTS